MLEKFAVGSAMPEVKRLRIVSDGRGALPLTLACTLEYDGEMAGLMRLESPPLFGLQCFLSGILRRLSGTMFIVIQEASFHVGFSHLDRLETDAQVVIAGRKHAWLNWWVGRWLLPWRFRRKYLMPRMNGKWLMDRPANVRYPWDPAVRDNPELLYSTPDNKAP